jgi:hypothetical protein
LLIALSGVLLVAGSPHRLPAQTFPPVAELRPQPDFPDPLLLMSGRRIETPEQWRTLRRPELLALFQYYMYGFFPPAPKSVAAHLDREDRQYFSGRATKKELTLRFGPAATPAIHLLLVIPNNRSGPAPVFAGLNFCGNHALLDDPAIALPEVWMRESCPGCEGNRATDAGRGSQKDVWAIEQSIERGYAVASCYCGDIDPDRNDFTDGVHPHFPGRDGKERGPHDWGTIAAWAWGLMRCVDYLVTDKDLDSRRIAVVGHSRLGKTALLAGAFDERIALVIPHQAGCGGSAPSRKTGIARQKAESVKRINTSFPHWFCDGFKQFNDAVDRLPFDQHCLVALCAPRPVLLTNALEDQWADPDGQFRVLQGADPVYRLVAADGLGAQAAPAPGTLLNSTLGYYIREGKHSMRRDDWLVFFEFADRHMRGDGS